MGEPNDPNEPVQLTRAAHERLRDELDRLQHEGRRQMAERLQRARELGDLSENAEYHATREEQAMMESRIRRLESTLRYAKIVERMTSADRASAGTFVTLRPVGGGEEEVYLLAGSVAERSENARTVTLTSPLGQAVAGKGVGDEVAYAAPGGTFTYEIVKVEPWDGV